MRRLRFTVMICDSNVWLALALSKHLHHTAARNWLDTIQEPAALLICRATQQSLLRLLTNAAVLAPYGNPPLTNREAWSTYESFVADDRIVFQSEEPEGLESLWKTFAVRGTASPKLWMDAYLAAFAMAGRHRMVTTDKGFWQFQGLDILVLGQRTS